MAFKGFIEDLPEREQKLAFFNKATFAFTSKRDNSVVRVRISVDDKDWVEVNDAERPQWCFFHRSKDKVYVIKGDMGNGDIALAKNVHVDVLDKDTNEILEKITIVKTSSLDGTLFNKIK